MDFLSNEIRGTVELFIIFESLNNSEESIRKNGLKREG